MNITEAISLEIGLGVFNFLKKTPEIQIYANSNIFEYQWHDRRFDETSDRWKNISYKTRSEMRMGLLEHLKSKGDY